MSHCDCDCNFQLGDRGHSCGVAATVDQHVSHHQPAIEASPLRVRVLRGLSSTLVCEVQLSQQAMVWELKFAAAEKGAVHWRMQKLLCESRILEDGDFLGDVLGNSIVHNVLEVSLVSIRTNDLPPLDIDGTVLFGTVGHDGLALKYVRNLELLDDENVVLRAISQNPKALAYASDRLRSNNEVVLQAVSREGMILSHASVSCRSNKRIVLAAIAQDGRAIATAKGTLRKDREIQKAALRKDARALQFCSSLCDDEEAVLDAVARDSNVFRHASARLINNEDFVLQVVACNGLALEHAATFAYDKKVVLVAVSHHGHALRFASLDLRADKEVVLRAVRQRGTAIRYAAHPLCSPTWYIHKQRIAELMDEFEHEVRDYFVCQIININTDKGEHYGFTTIEHRRCSGAFKSIDPQKVIADATVLIDDYINDYFVGAGKIELADVQEFIQDGFLTINGNQDAFWQRYVEVFSSYRNVWNGEDEDEGDEEREKRYAKVEELILCRWFR